MFIRSCDVVVQGLWKMINVKQVALTIVGNNWTILAEIIFLTSKGG